MGDSPHLQLPNQLWHHGEWHAIFLDFAALGPLNHCILCSHQCSFIFSWVSTKVLIALCIPLSVLLAMMTMELGWPLVPVHVFSSLWIGTHGMQCWCMVSVGKVAILYYGGILIRLDCSMCDSWSFPARAGQLQIWNDVQFSGRNKALDGRW